MPKLSKTQTEALRTVLAGGVVRDTPNPGRADWMVLGSQEALNGRTMWSLYQYGYIVLRKDGGQVPRFWRKHVEITDDGRAALGPADELTGDMRFRYRREGTHVWHKVWRTGEPEPSGWTVGPIPERYGITTTTT